MRYNTYIQLIAIKIAIIWHISIQYLYWGFYKNKTKMANQNGIILSLSNQHYKVSYHFFFPQIFSLCIFITVKIQEKNIVYFREIQTEAHIAT